MAMRPGHPSTHGYHIDHFTCGYSLHWACSGFSGPYDRYVCGCCCHDNPGLVSEADRAWIEKVRTRPQGVS
jgi:hypothetical protein